MREVYMRNGEGFALVYSITQKVSFDELSSFKSGIDRYHQDPVIVLVGNKLDLDAKREVTTDMGEKRAEEWNCKFLECSAKEDININEIFFNLIQLSWDRKGTPKKKKTRANCNLL
eukprot:TRINITY_DN205_c0_g1_i12.p1 TRINITY_DN205_c0_g1~~TRINITY_DN205_c0_g1_i12.p1  ORF type:complete len:116 (+),score=8.45 TRINITY_DN205_c0_g1_i12:463-810(+)